MVSVCLLYKLIIVKNFFIILIDWNWNIVEENKFFLIYRLLWIEFFGGWFNLYLMRWVLNLYGLESGIVFFFFNLNGLLEFDIWFDNDECDWIWLVKSFV